MTAFAYADSRYPIRADFGEVHRSYWAELARPGCWWSGAERVAIAAEVRCAEACGLCRERKAAVSPFAGAGEHEASAELPAPAVDAVHRLGTDPSRLSRNWLEKLHAAGLSDGAYVELLGVVVAVVSIDAFHRNLDLDLEPLPEPEAGEPSGYRPAGAAPGEAWVPWIEAEKAIGPEAGLYPTAKRAPNVFKAMSLVPDAVRAMARLSHAHYIPTGSVATPGVMPEGRALNRAQVELVAGRVSALNECFY